MAKKTEYEFRYIGDHAQDLADGRVLGQNATVKLTEEHFEDDHNKRLLREGLLIGIDESSNEIAEKARTAERRADRKEEREALAQEQEEIIKKSEGGEG